VDVGKGGDLVFEPPTISGALPGDTVTYHFFAKVSTGFRQLLGSLANISSRITLLSNLRSKTHVTRCLAVDSSQALLQPRLRLTLLGQHLLLQLMQPHQYGFIVAKQMATIARMEWSTQSMCSFFGPSRASSR
jgi:hypothetical protein